MRNRVGTANIGDCFYYVDTVSGWFQTKAGYWISSSYAKVMTDAEVDAYIKNNGGSGDTGTTLHVRLYRLYGHLHPDGFDCA